jgi:hypothetical protein
MAPTSKQSGGAFVGMAAVARQVRWAVRSISLLSTKSPKPIRECRHEPRPALPQRQSRQARAPNPEHGVNLTQIHLIFRTKLDRARERALDQIEAVLHEPYPEIRLQDE